MGSSILRSGDLNQRISILSATETNTSGQLVVTYTEVDKVWAKVISQRGGAAFEAARTNSKEIIRVGIRYRSDIGIKWAIDWLDQRYEILSIDRSEIGAGFLWLTAQISGAE